jgi:SulP family sulfate permease
MASVGLTERLLTLNLVDEMKREQREWKSRMYRQGSANILNGFSLEWEVVL